MVGAIERGIGLGNTVMDQPLLKRGREVQKMQQEQVLSGQLPITGGTVGERGLVQGSITDKPTYEAGLALAEARMAREQAEAAQVGQPEPMSLLDQARIDTERARQQAILSGGAPQTSQGEPVSDGQIVYQNIETPDGKVVRVAGTTDRFGQWKPVDLPQAGGGVAATEATKGQDAVDRAYAKEYSEYVAGGGAANAAKQIQAVEDAIAGLEKVDTASGPLVGNIPDAARKTFFPEGAAIQADIESAVQQTLRQTLGAQFTEKEGERLLARTFDPRAPEAENARRARNVLRQLKEAASMKEAAARYYEANGTLTGFQGKLPSLSDFDPNQDQAPEAKAPAPQAPTAGAPTLPPPDKRPDGMQFQGATWDAKKQKWIKVVAE